MADSIKVAVRVRPFNKREIQLQCTLAVKMEGHSTSVCLKKGKTFEDPLEEWEFKKFTFDYSYWSFDPAAPNYASQDTIMADMGEAILANASQGFNGCLFSYGQTGSGKTYSVLGLPEAPGIVYRMIQNLFERKKSLEEDPQKEFRLHVSQLEVYNEEVHDLLAASDNHGNLQIIDHPQLGVIVKDLMQVPCESADDVHKLLDYGTQRRVVAATNMNAVSSRSHTLFVMKTETLEGEKPAPGKKDKRNVLTAKLNLVDLAGSERASKTHAHDSQLKEANAINKSLSALGRIIHDLNKANISAAKGSAPGKTGKHHAGLGWRNSKLCFLMKDSLIGNSKTFMLAAISPASDNAAETLSTLEFAHSVKDIKLEAKQNNISADSTLDQLKKELEELRSHDHELEIKLEEDVTLIENMRQDYEEQLKQARSLMKKRSTDPEPNTPCLVNMSDDPVLAGRMLFSLPSGKTVTLGSDSTNDLKVSGPGIPGELCVIVNVDDTNLTIKKSGAEGRIMINGKQLKEDPVQLAHGMRLFFGRSIAFKVVIPSQAHLEDDRKDSLLLEGLEKEWACIEESASWGKLQVGLDQLLQQMSEEEAKRFTDRLEQVVHACDEANDISAACRSEEGFHFEANIITAPPVDVVVRVIHKRGSAPGFTEEGACLYAWTDGTMFERLERMQDYYHTLSRTGRRPESKIDDPWHQVSHADVQQALHDQSRRLEKETHGEARMAMAKERALDKIKALRSRAPQDAQADATVATTLGSASAESMDELRKALDAALAEKNAATAENKALLQENSDLKARLAQSELHLESNPRTSIVMLQKKLLAAQEDNKKLRESKASQDAGMGGAMDASEETTQSRASSSNAANKDSGGLFACCSSERYRPGR